MMNVRPVSFKLPQFNNGNLTFPLLDDGFDPDEEEIFEHSELTCFHTGHHGEDDFSM